MSTLETPLDIGFCWCCKVQPANSLKLLHVELFNYHQKKFTLHCGWYRVCVECATTVYEAGPLKPRHDCSHCQEVYNRTTEETPP